MPHLKLECSVGARYNAVNVNAKIVDDCADLLIRFLLELCARYKLLYKIDDAIITNSILRTYINELIKCRNV
jgi:hypothetical protein